MAKEWREEFAISGEEVLKKVKELLHEANVTKIILKNESGHTIIEVPLIIGAVAAVIAPVLAAIGAAAALITRCTLVVVRENPEPKK
jgi:Flp pilus assembly pilin Flp